MVAGDKVWPIGNASRRENTGGDPGRKHEMQRLLALSVAVLTSPVPPAIAQKPGGILQLQHFDSPTSMSILGKAGKTGNLLSRR
jgi:hypothetical protein